MCRTTHCETPLWLRWLLVLLMLRFLSVFTFFGTPFGELAYAYQSNVAGMATLDRDGLAEVVTMFSTSTK